MPADHGPLSIGELSAATGVATGTLRMWEARHGFPVASRPDGGHRRFDPADVERIARVVEDRSRGLSLAAAIDRARRWAPAAPPSVFSALRREQPELQPVRLPVAGMLAVSRAIEDECLARAVRPVLAASFQREAAYRRAAHRWRELSRTAALVFVLAEFARARAPRGGPAEVPIAADSRIAREWAVICLDEELTACVTGWERADDGGRRTFEAIWTTDPEAVAVALRAAAGLAGGEIAAHAERALAERAYGASADPARTVALANRMVAYLAATQQRV